jgi:hypothetical protein
LGVELRRKAQGHLFLCLQLFLFLIHF